MVVDCYKRKDREKKLCKYKEKRNTFNFIALKPVYASKTKTNTEPQVKQQMFKPKVYILLNCVNAQKFNKRKLGFEYKIKTVACRN